MHAPNTTPATTHLGKYRVLRKLGSGGMAEVFLAKSVGAEQTEKLLVIKRMLPRFAQTPKLVSMFVDEARLAMRLNHPNIVQVYSFEQVDGELLLTMEYVEGLDLGRLISAAKQRNLRMPFGLVAYVMIEIARGLDYAHNRLDKYGEPLDIVHRDVSPQNILLSFEGAVKLTDFGIAKARTISGDSGVVQGKFAYMSPEQARGETCDRRSDIYSLGIVLSELLMGRAMHPKKRGLALLESVSQNAVTFPRDEDPSVPSELDAIAREALATKISDRFASAREMVAALSHFWRGQGQADGAESLERWTAQVLQQPRIDSDALEDDATDLQTSVPFTIVSSLSNTDP